MRLKRKIIKTAAALLSAAFLGLYGTAGYYSARLPDVITADRAEDIKIAGFPELSCCTDTEAAIPAAQTCSGTERVTLSPFGQFPLKMLKFTGRKLPFLLWEDAPSA